MTNLVERETKVQEHVVADDEFVGGRNFFNDFREADGGVQFVQLGLVTLSLATILFDRVDLKDHKS